MTNTHRGRSWSLQDACPGEETSKITIFGVEQAPQGKRIVHIHVDGIKLKNSSGSDAPEKVEHMPFAKEFIDQSVTDVIGKGQAPIRKWVQRVAASVGRRQGRLQ